MRERGAKGGESFAFFGLIRNMSFERRERKWAREIKRRSSETVK